MLLVLSHRCIFGQQPRKFDATRGQLLANMAELLVRQFERNWAMRVGHYRMLHANICTQNVAER